MIGNSIKKLAVVVAVLGASIAAYGSVYVSESFEGSIPTDGWTFLDNGAVLTNDGPESAITGTAGGKSLDVDMTSAGVPQAQLSIGGISGVETGLEFRISFDYNPADYSLVQHAFMLRGNANVVTAIQLALCADGTGNVRNHNGTTYGSILGTLVQGAWYHVEIVTVPQNNAGDDTYDLTITDTNGTAVVSATNLDFRTDVTSYDELRWYFNTGTAGNDGQFYIDNVDVRTTTVAAPTNITSMINQDFNSDANGFDLVGDTADRTGTESGLTGLGGGASIKVHDVTNASNPYAEAAFVMDNTDEPLNVVFDLNINQGAGENIAFRLKDVDDDTDGILLTLNFFNGSGIYNHNGTANQPLGVVLDQQAWYRVWITASAESDIVKTYDLTIYTAAGTVVTNIAGLPFKANINSYDSVRWFFNNAVGGQGDRFYIDNVFVGTTIPGPTTPNSLWSDWLSIYAGAMGAETNLSDDADGDLLDNLAEYALGGIPTNAADRGNAPRWSVIADGGSNYLEYVYYMRDDATARGLSYSLETDTDLIFAPGWTNAIYEVVGTNTSTGISGFDAVTCRIPTDVEATQFINLKVKFTP